MDANQNIEEAVRRIVHAHSGGIKGLELFFELVEQGFPANTDVEAIVTRMSDLCILRYAWHMSANLSREKIFVYTA